MTVFTTHQTAEIRRQSKAASGRSASPHGGVEPHGGLLQLQRAVGNRIVNQLVRRDAGDTTRTGIQPRLQAPAPDPAECSTGTSSRNDEQEMPAGLATVLNRGGARPLEPQPRAALEAGFGCDLSDLRLQTGRDAQQAAASLG